MVTTTTVRLPEEKLKLTKAIAGYEGCSLSKVFETLVDEYIAMHRETMELLGIPSFEAECLQGLEEIKRGKGKRLE
ncbi:MAG: hypothetical protein WC081_02065 [Candidatus Ratteibacteria bacterium]